VPYKFFHGLNEVNNAPGSAGGATASRLPSSSSTSDIVKQILAHAKEDTQLLHMAQLLKV
jgi:hypothetical protein